MLKRILSLMKQDLANAKRDNLVLYMLFAPLLLAIGARLLMPSVEAATVRLAASAHLPSQVLEQLESYTDLELYETSEEVLQRVNKPDDIAGIILDEDGTIAIVLEGNEPGPSEEIAVSIMNTVLMDEGLGEYEYTRFNSEPSKLRDYTAIVIILMAVFIGGLFSAFNMIDEKENGAIRGLAVSPLRLLDYFTARGILAVIIGLFITYGSALIIAGTTINYWELTGAYALSVMIPFLVGILVGGFADNQIKAIALLKIIILPFVMVPLASIFIAQRWHFFFYPFPNYWMFKTFENVFLTDTVHFGFWFSGILTLLLGAVFVLLLGYSLRKKLRLR